MLSHAFISRTEEITKQIYKTQPSMRHFKTFVVLGLGFFCTLAKAIRGQRRLTCCRALLFALLRHLTTNCVPLVHQNLKEMKILELTTLRQPFFQ